MCVSILGQAFPTNQKCRRASSVQPEFWAWSRQKLLSAEKTSVEVALKKTAQKKQNHKYPRSCDLQTKSNMRLVSSLLISNGVRFARAMSSTSTYKTSKTTLMLNWYANPYHTPIFVAKEKGWLQEEGIDIAVQHCLSLKLYARMFSIECHHGRTGCIHGAKLILICVPYPLSDIGNDQSK